MIEVVAPFLAEFVRDVELPNSKPPDRDQSVWHGRLNRWWQENPYCRDDALLGLGLREASGNLVGFHGFIPHDYIAGGTIVPALLATTFFVRQAHRQAALSLLMRVKRIGNQVHIVDGSPSVEMQALMERLDFQRSPSGSHCYRIVGGRRFHSLKAPLGNTAAWLFNRVGRTGLGRYRLIESPGELERVPEFSDAKLRKRVTKAGLHWLVGNGAKSLVFRGLCDDAGVLRAYFVAQLKSRFGVCALRIMETENFDEDDQTLIRLLDYVTNSASQANLPTSVDLIVWSLPNEDRPSGWLFRTKWQAPIFYRLPKSLDGVDKVFQASEGDMLLL